MKRNLIFCIPFLFLWALALPLGTAHGQGAVDILNNTMDIQFPSGVVFALEAESPGVIENVDLFYGTSERTCQAGDTRQAFDFDPDPRVELSWEWEWKRSGILPPGAQLWWEWEITLESGEVVRTPRETITVEDQRFDWQRIDEDEIVVRWINGDEAFGRRIHDIALESLAQQSREMGISQDGVIHITIYPTVEELREALVVAAEWTGGVALSDYNSLITAIAPGETAWANSVIPHELNHLLVNTLFFNCRGASMPTWLVEGLAEYAEDAEDLGDMGAITAQLETDSLPRLRALARGFSAYGDDARLAYFQSKLIVSYLYGEFGSESVLTLLETLRGGETIDRSLEAVYEVDTDGLDGLWRESLGFSLPEEVQEEGDAPTKTPIPTVPLLDLGLQPSPTATNTPLPPPASPTPEPVQVAQAEATPTPAAEEAAPTAPPETPEKEQSGISLSFILAAGAGALVLIALVVYFQFFRR